MIADNFMTKFSNCNITKKTSFRASKRLYKFRTQKNAKIVNYQNCEKVVLSQLEKVGGHRYPPGSFPEMFFLDSGMHAGSSWFLARITKLKLARINKMQTGVCASCHPSRSFLSAHTTGIGTHNFFCAHMQYFTQNFGCQHT